jgi:hypothetical protein
MIRRQPEEQERSDRGVDKPGKDNVRSELPQGSWTFPCLQGKCAGLS